MATTDTTDLSDFNLTEDAIAEVENSGGLDELVIDEMSRRATNICNDGVEAQVRFLVEAGLKEEALEAIRTRND